MHKEFKVARNLIDRSKESEDNKNRAKLLFQSTVDAILVSRRIDLKADKIDLKNLTTDEKYALFSKLHIINKEYISNHPEFKVDPKNIKRIDKLLVRRKLDIDQVLLLSISDNTKLINEYVERQKQLLVLERKQSDKIITIEDDLIKANVSKDVIDVDLREVYLSKSPLDTVYEFKD